MPTDACGLDFHGVTVLLRAENEADLDELRRDFAHFEADVARPPEIELEVRRQMPPPPKGRAFWRWRSARIFSHGSRRTIDYEGRALLKYDFKNERGVLYGADAHLLHELAYLAILSRVGAKLERRGLHRVHALGFSYRFKGGLLLLPSGGGKSRLGLELIGREGFQLLSDDTPLIKTGGRELAAFPTRIGLRGDDGRGIAPEFLRPFLRRRFGPKNLVDYGYFRDSVGAAAPLNWILVGGRSGGGPWLGACSKTRAAAAMAANLVLGIGTPQILELMAPAAPYAAGTWGLAQTASRRALCAGRAVAAARCARFLLARDPKANADALEAFLAASF